MRKLILTAAVLGLVAADASAFGRLRGRVRAAFQPQTTCGTCAAAPQAGPVRQAVGNVFEHTGSVLVGAGNVIHSTTFRPVWDAPACSSGSCPTIPATNLPVR